MRKRLGQVSEVDNLLPLAFALIILIVMAGVGALMLSEFEVAAGDTDDVNNETFNATSDPFTYTVADASDSDFLAITRIQDCFDDVGQSTTATCTILDDRAGTVNVTGLQANPDDRNQSIDYEHSADNDAAGILDTGIGAILDLADFFTVIVVIGVAAVIFLLLAMVRRSGRAASR